jgi:hypothetical protein
VRTLVLQTLVAALLVVFAIVCAAIARRARGVGAQQTSWRIMAGVFGAYAAVYLAHALFAVAAYVLGPGARVFSAYLAVTPALNHSRTFLLFVLYALLGMVALRAPHARLSSAIVAGTIGLALAAGASLGMAEGALDVARHFPTTAAMDTAGFLMLGVVLILAIHRDSMDRLLWIALALHATSIVVGILYFTVLAWFDTPGAWRPPSWHIHLIRTLLIAGQIAIAVWRFRIEARGGPVPGLIGGAPRRTVTIG